MSEVSSHVPQPQEDPKSWLTKKDFSRSRTSYDLDDLRAALMPVRSSGVQRLLDIGCGFGGLSAFGKEFIGAREVHGVDIDERVVEEAMVKGVKVQLVDAGNGRLPYPDEHFDFVMTLGMMDYLPSFDGMIREINRVTPRGGRVLVSLPNLGSWHNRITLLLGYQPRDVEVSNEVLAGAMGRYAGGQPAGHIHIPTVKAFAALMEHHGFKQLRLTGGRPRMNQTNRVVKIVDALFTRRPTLARRFYYLGVKERSTPPPSRPAGLPFQSLDG